MMTNFITPADLLVRGLGLPSVQEKPVELPQGTACAITGQPITIGYSVSDMVTGATAEFLDCFRGGVHGYVSEAAARCFRSANPRVGNPCARSVLAFEDGTLWNPLISAEAAIEQDRPAWTSLVREVWPGRRGQRCLMIITTDTKKRLWIRARVGTLGSRTPLLYYDSKTAGNEVFILDWSEMIACLDYIELVYAAGFPKEAIRVSLYIASKIVGSVGLNVVRGWESTLAAMRRMPEFRVALLAAQKPIQSEEEKQNGYQPNFLAHLGEG